MEVGSGIGPATRAPVAASGLDDVRWTCREQLVVERLQAMRIACIWHELLELSYSTALIQHFGDDAGADGLPPSRMAKRICSSTPRS